MPIKNPRKGQNQKEYISSCMSDLSKEFPNQRQRSAVCFQKWRDRTKKAKGADISWEDEPKDFTIIP